MSPAASHLVSKQCVSFSAAVILVAAAHLFTLQARSSSRRAASTRVPRHHFTRLLAVHHCIKLLLTNFPVWNHAGRTWSPITSRGEHSGPADPSCSLSACCLDLHSLSPAPSTSHRTLLLCCPSRADPTQLSNTFHMTGLYSNSTHPHCRSPAGPRAVSQARLQLVLYGRSASLCRSLQRYHFPVVALFLLAPMSPSCHTHLRLL
jgi:hypothetical protein